jgi:predicted transglutaminase-like cysteine proteinase
MRKLSILLSMIAAILLVGFQIAEAGLLGMPMNLKAAYERIKFDTPTLAPMAYTQFCMRYEGECQKRTIFRGGPISLTPDRLAELIEVNKSVNRSIVPERNELGLAGETWLIGPDRGDCNDYAVTKRHELLVRGWPARALLLSEVVVRSGEHHLVLVVRTRGGDLVLDNLTPQIRPWSRAPYLWVRIQMPTNPRYWAAMKDREA